MANYSLAVNGKTVPADIESGIPLLWVLQDFTDLKGIKHGYEMGLCRACTIYLSEQVQRSGFLPVSNLKPGDVIATIGGVSDSPAKDVQKDRTEEQVFHSGNEQLPVSSYSCTTGFSFLTNLQFHKLSGRSGISFNPFLVPSYP